MKIRLERGDTAFEVERAYKFHHLASDPCGICRGGVLAVGG